MAELNRTCKQCGTDYHDPGGDVEDPKRFCPTCGSRAWYAGPDIRLGSDVCEGCGKAVHAYKTADGWVWRHTESKRFACDEGQTHAHVNGTTRIPGYGD